jgi:type II secretory pathway pseudopilin PulG
MIFKRTAHSTRAARDFDKSGFASAAFTLAEVLAALAFMAIVIPVAVEGLRIANHAGQVGHRKAVAARIADRVLNEAIVTGQWRTSTQGGTIQEGQNDYRWALRSEPWQQGAMRLVTVQVIFPAQGENYDVNLSTLVDGAQ